MRRAVPVILATLAAIGLLASFHTSPGVSTRSLAGAPRSNRPSAAAPPPQDSTTTKATDTASRQIDGPVVSNRWGDVQVQVTYAGGRLVDIQALQLPFDRARSAEISQFAEPELRSEALQAQSANIDVISGATYTSDSYAQSLQGALDKAKGHTGGQTG